RRKAFPMGAAMRFQPLLLGGRVDEALKVATRVQSLAAPVRRGKERHLHLAPVRRAATAILVVERMREDVGVVVNAVAHELFVGEFFRPADELSGDAAAGSAIAKAVLYAVN